MIYLLIFLLIIVLFLFYKVCQTLVLLRKIVNLMVKFDRYGDILTLHSQVMQAIIMRDEDQIERLKNQISTYNLN